MLSKIIVLVTIVLILASLASGLYFMMKDKGKSDRTVKALTVRIGLSITLFIFLIIGFATGLLQPHGVLPPQPQAQVDQNQ